MRAGDESRLAELMALVAQVNSGGLAIPAASVHRSTSLISLGLDSMQQLELLARVEDKFDVSVPDDRADQVRVMGDILDLVEELSCR